MAFDYLVVVMSSIEIYATESEDGGSSVAERSCCLFTEQHVINSQTAYI